MRKRSLVRIALLVGGLVVSAALLQQTACTNGPPPQAPGADRSEDIPVLPFRAGERTFYRASLAGVHIADLEWRVENARHEGRPALAVSYRAESSPAVSRFSEFELEGRTLADARTLRPMLGRKKSVKPDETKTVTMTYYHDADTALYHRVEVQDEEEDVREQEVDFSNGWDMLSGLTYLRTQYPRLVGAGPVSMTMLDGRERVDMVIAHQGAESIEIGGETWQTERFEFRMRKYDEPGDTDGEWHTFSVWVSPEIWQPVRFDAALLMGRAGSVELLDYEPGTDPVGAAPN